MTNVYSCFLCGGSGTRLWPLSRLNNPKQFVSFDNSGLSILQQSINRIQQFSTPEQVWLILSKDYEQIAKRQCLQNVGHMILEPEAKNTAAAVALCAYELYQKDPDAIMLILSSDQIINNIKAFENSISKAIQLAEQGYSTVVGIKPNYPATGFGYIEIGDYLNKNGKITSDENESIGYKVKNFKEKPNKELAEQFFMHNKYLWNAGMFIWRVKNFWHEFSELNPDFANQISSITPQNLARIYRDLPKLPIDIAYVEKAKNVACVSSFFDWNDIGSWPALKECFGVNEQNNYLHGDIYTQNTTHSTIYSSGPFVSVIGLSNVIVVATKESVLVVNEKDAQEVKNVVEYLKTNHKTELL